MSPLIVHADDVPETEGRYPAPFDAEALSHGRDLGRAAGVERLGTWLERLPPGRRTARMHAHLREEETVYVLAGTPRVRWRTPEGDAGEAPLRPGSFVVFRAGTGLAHYVDNPGPEEARLLVVGERCPGERVAYPEDPELEAWRAEQGSNRRWPDAAGRHPRAVPPAWRIRTERVELRPWRLTDVPAFIALQVENRDHLLPWMTWAADTPTEDEIAARFLDFQDAFARGKDFVYGIFRDGLPIGGTGVHFRVGPRAAEIGYWLAKEEEGKGLVTEVARALTRVGLDVHGYERMEIRMDPTNRRSAAVPARLGYTHEATLSRRVERASGLGDVEIWAFYRSDLGALEAGDPPLQAWDVLDRRLV